MRGIRMLATGVVVLVVALVGFGGPVAAQGEGVTVTPATDLVDGQEVTITATAAPGDTASLALCIAGTVPAVGGDFQSALDALGTCVPLRCFYDGEVGRSLADVVAPYCPLEILTRPITTVTITATVRRVIAGQDCALVGCVVGFNTWTESPADGIVRVTGMATVPVSFDAASPTTTMSPYPTVAPVPSTTVALSAPTAVSTTVATDVLGAVETNPELAYTGAPTGLLAALGAALVALGLVVRRRVAPASA